MIETSSSWDPYHLWASMTGVKLGHEAHISRIFFSLSPTPKETVTSHIPNGTICFCHRLRISHVSQCSLQALCPVATWQNRPFKSSRRAGAFDTESRHGTRLGTLPCHDRAVLSTTCQSRRTLDYGSDAYKSGIFGLSVHTWHLVVLATRRVETSDTSRPRRGWLHRVPIVAHGSSRAPRLWNASCQ